MTYLIEVALSVSIVLSDFDYHEGHEVHEVLIDRDYHPQRREDVE